MTPKTAPHDAPAFSDCVPSGLPAHRFVMGAVPGRNQPNHRRLFRPLLLWIAVTAIAISATGCQGPLSSGLKAFDESRQVEEGQLSGDDRTRWALYTGLTELSLGNQRRALVALQKARCGLQRIPESLSPSERGRLDSAWRSLGRMPGEALGKGCVLASASCG